MIRIFLSILLFGFILTYSGTFAYTESEKPLVSNHKQLTSVKAMKGYAEWSPDGKFIAVRSGTHIEQDFRLVVLNADGSNPRELTKPAEGVFVYFPSWSPDGKHILYTQDDMNVEVISIVVVDADGSNQRTLASDANLSSWPPAWSPDGKQIVFMMRDDEIFDLYVMNADGSNPHKVATGLGHCTNVFWRRIS